MISSILPSPNVRLIPVEPAPLDADQIDNAWGDLADLSSLIDSALYEKSPEKLAQLLKQINWLAEIYS